MVSNLYNFELSSSNIFTTDIDPYLQLVISWNQETFCIELGSLDSSRKKYHILSYRW